MDISLIAPNSNGPADIMPLAFVPDSYVHAQDYQHNFTAVVVRILFYICTIRKMYVNYYKM